MRIINSKLFIKYKKKNIGNTKLLRAIDSLLSEITNNNWKDRLELKNTGIDADCVHNDGFFFFNIDSHRTMILIEFEDEDATAVWIGSHKDYELTFKNNKNTIHKWLRNNGWI